MGYNTKVIKGKHPPPNHMKIYPATETPRVTNYELQKIMRSDKYKHILENHVGNYPTEKVLARLANLITCDLNK